MKFIIVALCLIAATLAQTQQAKDGVKVEMINNVVLDMIIIIPPFQTKHFGFGYNGYNSYPVYGAGYHYPSYYPAHSHYPGHYYGGYYNPYQPSLYPAGFPPVLRNNKKN